MFIPVWLMFVALFIYAGIAYLLVSIERDIQNSIRHALEYVELLEERYEPPSVFRKIIMAPNKPVPGSS